jgi:ABC-type lipoprotein release transport system permease subunit
MIVRQSLTMVAAGLIPGIAIAVFAVRPLAVFLVPEVRTGDIGNFVLVGAVLGAVAAVATLAPQLRAVRVDPVAAPRYE